MHVIVCRWTGRANEDTFSKQKATHAKDGRERQHPGKEVPLQVNASLNSFFTCIMKYNII